MQSLQQSHPTKILRFFVHAGTWHISRPRHVILGIAAHHSPVRKREGCQASYLWYCQDKFRFYRAFCCTSRELAAWPGCAQVFFCKYNDPIYVKMEKLEIMIALASDRNVDQVLLEFKEYATEVDVDFVRKASVVVCI